MNSPLAPADLLRDVSRRRTFAIISHPDAGKTTLTEKLLLFGGAIQLAGTGVQRQACGVRLAELHQRQRVSLDPLQRLDEIRRQRDLQEILKYLYIAVEAGDFTPGAIHWTRELRSWLSLKFDPTKEQRVKLVKFYYELALAPGIEPSVAERFSSDAKSWRSR